MKLEDVTPAHCYARAQHLLAEAKLIREELGRAADGRPVPEITGAQPREVYFEAIVAWRKSDRLSAELGVRSSQPSPAVPALNALRPGHCLQLLDAVGAHLDDVTQRLGITERPPEVAIEPSRQPSDVLATVIRVNRELSRSLERPFTPSDVYRTVALASAYATRLGASASPAPFERQRRPADCYATLDECLGAVAAVIGKRGDHALAARGTPPDVVPGDVYDLANLVLGEIAYLHAITPGAAPLYAFEPGAGGHRLPAHVHQLARTLRAQLATLE
jgi:hypothetical protein